MKPEATTHSPQDRQFAVKSWKPQLFISGARESLGDSEEARFLEVVFNFINCLDSEISEAGYNEQEVALIKDTRLYYGRYFNPKSQNYVLQTIVPNLASALMFFGGQQIRKMQILDLGCGLGMQSLLFSMLGAKVVAVDIRENSIALCKKRKAYYEDLLNHELELDFICDDFLALDSKAYKETFDGMFSMSAFSYISPMKKTVELAANMLKPNARIFLYESNSQHLMRRFSQSTPPPGQVSREFQYHGFVEKKLSGAAALPHFFWSNPENNSAMHKLNNTLKQFLALSFSYVLCMRRDAQNPSSFQV